MATCFCKQPCEKHKFPAATAKEWRYFMREFKVNGIPLKEKFYDKDYKYDDEIAKGAIA